MTLQFFMILIFALTAVKSLTKFKLRVLDIALIASAGVLFSFRTIYEVDTYAYNMVYEAFLNGKSPPETYGIDSGFLLLMQLSVKCGLSFYLFRLAVFLISIMLILSTIRLYTERYSLVLCLYLFFPFCYDRIQIRQLLSYAIVIFAWRFITGERKRPVIYTLFVLLASAIHLTSLVFLLYLLILLPNQRILKGFFITAGVFSVIAVMGGANVIGLLGKIISSEKFTRYGFDASDYRMNFYLQLFEIVMFSAFIAIDSRILERREDEHSYALSCMVKYSVIFLPFVLFSLTFERLMRPFLILTYTAAAMKYSDSKSRRRWLPLIAVTLLVIIRMSVTFGYITDLFGKCELINAH